jgi:hypothetical protein
LRCQVVGLDPNPGWIGGGEVDCMAERKLNGRQGGTKMLGLGKRLRAMEKLTKVCPKSRTNPNSCRQSQD